MKHALRLAVAAVLVIVGNNAAFAESSTDAKSIRAQLLSAKPGDFIELPEGNFDFKRGLSLKANQVTLRGAGMDKTILSFKNQVKGAEGLLVIGNDIVIEDLAIEDAKGDGLKVTDSKNVTLRRIRAEWTNGPAEENGAYGLYPVQTENLLVDGAVAIGASDAGIYVGQSKNVIVRNSRAELNVAGIEIENTVGADVFENVATKNTGGILVFDLPNLSQAGHTARIFRNKIYENNTPNFAAEGNIVASVPAGSGILVSSTNKVEIFNNQIENNQTSNIAVVSYLYTGLEIKDENFYPYPESIFIHGNTYVGGGDTPDSPELSALRDQAFAALGRLPDIVWDGFVNPKKAVEGNLPAAFGICIAEPSASFAKLDVANEFAGLSVDRAAHDCRHDPLPVVTLPFDAS